MTELNPNHPVTIVLRRQWHKLCAILMLKFGHQQVRITVADIESMVNSGVANIAMRAQGEVVILQLVDDKEAARLAREEGGLQI